MVIWGVVSTCTAAVQSVTGLVPVRFFIGFVEASAARSADTSYYDIRTHLTCPVHTSQELGALDESADAVDGLTVPTLGFGYTL